MAGHRITASDSCWLFIAASQEPRHLSDIVFGASVLRARGVPMDRILVFTDHPAPGTILSGFGLANVHPLADLVTVAPTLESCTACVTVVTGHGVHDGIGQQAPALAPCDVLAATRGVPGVTCGVVVVGQCFAGVFNYLDAVSDCPVALLGATNLNTSLSVPVKLSTRVQGDDGSSTLETWSANLFLYHFFLWLQAPVDVDGDGLVTLIDAYKYAGTRSSSATTSVKSQTFVEATLLAAELPALRDQFQDVALRLQQGVSAATTPAELLKMQVELQQAKLAFESRVTRLDERLQVLHSHQDAWVLHANFARTVSFWES
ncbi:MAG: hypothetical protein OXU20_07525 [Myxococcales bacterium]|nr:hypothetical protein [Myxococcales bacterium]MDD9966514.1 hypothetical protein [Myxococcales bacterium]